MSRDGSSAGFGIGILIGVIAGVVAGVLYAPKPGEETRKCVENTITDFVEKHAPEIEKSKHEALTSIDVIRYQFEKKCNKIIDSIKAKHLAKAKEKETANIEMN